MLITIRTPGAPPLAVLVEHRLEIGRQCAGLRLDDPMLSRRHLELVPEGGGVVVRDLGSTNGTTINRRDLVGPHVLGEGDVVAFGSSSLTVRSYGLPERLAPDQLSATSIDIVAASFAELPVPLVAEHGTTTIVFSDIESSTAMADRLGDAAWFELLERHNSIVRRQLALHRGTEIKSQGDGFMLSFGSARHAVQCMSAVQHDLARYSSMHPDTPLSVRVGIHTGEAITDADGDLFGRHVILASRIANSAGVGEILVSSLVAQIVETHGDITFGAARAAVFKGLSGTYEVIPVLWDAMPAQA